MRRPLQVPQHRTCLCENRHSAAMRLLIAVLAATLVAAAQSRLSVKVDPRIELMAVTQILADYGWTGLLNKADTPTVATSTPGSLRSKTIPR